MRLWPCRGVLTAAAQSIAKNGQKMTQKWPFLTLKNAFFYFFVEDSHRARKVQIANVRSRIYERLILTSYSRFLIFKKFDKFSTSFSTKWPFLGRISNFVAENIHQISSYTYSIEKITCPPYKLKKNIWRNCTHGKALWRPSKGKN